MTAKESFTSDLLSIFHWMKWKFGHNYIVVTKLRCLNADLNSTISLLHLVISTGLFFFTVVILCVKGTFFYLFTLNSDCSILKARDDSCHEWLLEE